MCSSSNPSYLRYARRRNRVQTDVTCNGGLPLQLRVSQLRIVQCIVRVLLVTCTIIFTATISPVSCLIHGRADTACYLLYHKRNGVSGLDNQSLVFFIQGSSAIRHPNAAAGEVAQTVVLHKLRRTISTHSECQQIAVCIRVVQTAEERKSTIYLTQ